MVNQNFFKKLDVFIKWPFEAFFKENAKTELNVTGTLRLSRITLLPPPTPHTHILSLLDSEALFGCVVSQNIPGRSSASQSSLSHGSELCVQKALKPEATRDDTALAVLV